MITCRDTHATVPKKETLPLSSPEGFLNLEPILWFCTRRAFASCMYKKDLTIAVITLKMRQPFYKFWCTPYMKMLSISWCRSKFWWQLNKNHLHKPSRSMLWHLSGLVCTVKWCKICRNALELLNYMPKCHTTYKWPLKSPWRITVYTHRDAIKSSRSEMISYEWGLSGIGEIMTTVTMKFNSSLWKLRKKRFWSDYQEDLHK